MSTEKHGVFLFNPYTGGARLQEDIKSDPYGLLIRQPGAEPLAAMELPSDITDGRFARHTAAVEIFVNEMYSLMVDPVDQGEVKIVDATKALLVAAENYRNLTVEQAPRLDRVWKS